MPCAIVSELQINQRDWTELITMIQSALSNAPSPPRGSAAPITAFTRKTISSSVNALIRTAASFPVSMRTVDGERKEAVEKLKAVMKELHPIVQESLATDRERIRHVMARESFSNFIEEDVLLADPDEFSQVEKISLREKRFCVSGRVQTSP